MSLRERKVRIALLAVLLGLSQTALGGQVSTPRPSLAMVAGAVRGASGKPLAGATISLSGNGESKTTTTDAAGKFGFVSLPAGSYMVSVECPGFHSRSQSVALEAKQQMRLDFALTPSSATLPQSAASPSLGTMEFQDKPDFTVAGITDWTAAGGHGSDANLRASEALARDTRRMETEKAVGEPSMAQSGVSAESEGRLRAALANAPGSFSANHELGEFYFHSHRDREAVPLLDAAYRIEPGNFANAYDLARAYENSGELAQAREQVRRMLASGDGADLHRLLGDIDEQTKDPLAAVREYQRAAQMDSSEPNYFAWAEELLLHRAVQPAIEVFTKGASAYPSSERMLAGLGAALYAGGSYDAAAQQLCAASDLQPADPTPYIFLGKMEQAAPQPLPCVEEKLRRFLRDQPENAEANYDYAMALRKRERLSGETGSSQRIETMLEKALKIDPDFAQASLQLGILYSARRDFTKAVPAFKGALAADPNLAEAYFQLGQAYERTGNRAQAKQQLQAYERLRKTQAAAIEQQRREVQQFVVVLKGQPEISPKTEH
jgi:tetratricopeptide (TPR) repeat protein